LVRSTQTAEAADGKGKFIYDKWERGFVSPLSILTTALLLLYYCFITVSLPAGQFSCPSCFACWSVFLRLLLYYCFTTALLLLYYCFTTALLLLCLRFSACFAFPAFVANT
jgi:hypothetical protein